MALSITSFNRGEFVDLEIFFEEGDAPPAGEEQLLCELVVEALVGQAIAVERIGRVEHRLVTDIEGIAKATPMRYQGSTWGMCCPPTIDAAPGQLLT